jgi:hypothetical protein
MWENVATVRTLTGWCRHINRYNVTPPINYSKTCLKRNAIAPFFFFFFFFVFTGFRFTKGCVLIKQSTKTYDRLGLQ